MSNPFAQVWVAMRSPDASSRSPGGRFVAPVHKPAPNGPGPRLRIVVVDDNLGFRESLIELLQAGGHEVAGEASDGLQALDVVAAAEPDVVLMDIRMPAMDGIEATRRLKAAHPGLGVVALTAQEDDSVVREMLVAGASGYVLKDSDGEDILNAVLQAARGGAVISPAVGPAVIEQLTEALERERQRARQLEEAHAALVERSARRHELVSRLGHELRTPVTVILGIARTLVEGTSQPEHQRDLLERLASRAADLSRLVERFEVATDEGSEDFVDVTRLARKIAGDRRRVRVSEGTSVAAVWANGVLVRRILEELVDNACRFSPPATFVDVEVTRSRDQRTVEVRVIDRGPGVRPEDRDRIFEPLEQGEALDARTHQGAGVGLSMGRAAARAMDGDLVLERSDQSGSTFLWTLPVSAR
ncbi:MAG: response regulator [Actinomycetota bacterium]|nr:response regulator [Actinomycetota bacterium]